MDLKKFLELKNKNILICVSDAGSGLFISPIVPKIKKKNKVKIFSGEKSSIAIKNSNLTYIKHDNKKTFKQNALEIIKDSNYDYILLGTSLGSSVEKELTQLSLKSSHIISIIDHCPNPSLRFANIEKKEKNFYLTKIIWVISATTKKTLIKNNIKKSTIFIVEHPYLSCLQKVSNYKKNLIKKKLQIDYDTKVITYVSEGPPKKNIKWRNREVHASVIKKNFIKLINTVNSLPEYKSYLLIIKRHPTEKSNFLNREINKIKINTLIIEDQIEVKNIISISDLCIGMGSMMLFESALSGVKTITMYKKLSIDSKNIKLKNSIMIDYIRSERILYQYILNKL